MESEFKKLLDMSMLKREVLGIDSIKNIEKKSYVIIQYFQNYFFNQMFKNILKRKFPSIISPQAIVEDSGLFDTKNLSKSYPKLQMTSSFHDFVKNTIISFTYENSELLGQMFELFLSFSERRGKSGSFYTPPLISRYMARNAINKFLMQKLKISSLYHESDFEVAWHLHHKGKTKIILFQNHLDDKENYIGLINALHDELLNIKICDNAVGSGTFLISAGEYLNFLWNQLKSIKKDGKDGKPENLKKKIVEFNLNGIDIFKTATDICKLRLWLWIHEDSNKNLIKFSQIKLNIKNKNTLTDSLKEKYDVIIGNPPYGQNKLDKSTRNIIKESWKTSYTIGSKKDGKSYNPSAAFIERSWHQLRENGILCYLVNNSIGRVDEFKCTRKLLLEKFILNEVIDEGNPFTQSKVTLEMITIIGTKKNIILSKNDKNLVLKSRRNSDSVLTTIDTINPSLWIKYNRFILYQDEMFQNIYSSRSIKINILHGKRGRDVKKSKIKEGKYQIPYLFTGKSVHKYKIMLDKVEYAPKDLLKTPSWLEEYNSEFLVTTKINNKFRVVLKPKGYLVGNNVIKLYFSDDDNEITSKIDIYCLMAILNSTIMDKIVNTYIINKSELTVAFYDSITMFAPLKLLSRKSNTSKLLSNLSKLCIKLRNNNTETSEDILSYNKILSIIDIIVDKLYYIPEINIEEILMDLVEIHSDLNTFLTSSKIELHTLDSIFRIINNIFIK